MIAATCPFSTVRFSPFRIGRSSTLACKFLISSKAIDCPKFLILSAAPTPAPNPVSLAFRHDHHDRDQGQYNDQIRRHHSGVAAVGGNQRNGHRADEGGSPEGERPALPRHGCCAVAIVARFEPVTGHHPTPRQPTLPSRLTEMSFCASTANSIGRVCSTSLTKPLTTNATASSSERPRCMQ